MNVLTRLVVWATAGAIALLADAVTKAVPHSPVVYNYSRTPVAVFIVVALFLCLVAVRQGYLVAIGAGLMFGGLCGNAGQLLLQGYATDWIPLGGWFTNVADVSGAIGLACCCLGYGMRLLSRG